MQSKAVCKQDGTKIKSQEKQGYRFTPVKLCFDLLTGLA